MIGFRKKVQLVQHADSAATGKRAITGNEFDCAGAVVTLLRLDDDDGKVAFTFFMQNGERGRSRSTGRLSCPSERLR